MKIDLMQLEFIDLNLRKILTDVEKDTGMEFTITSLFRIGDQGVHGQLPLRGIDLRMRSRAIGEEIVDMINNKWIYNAGGQIWNVQFSTASD